VLLRATAAPDPVAAATVSALRGGDGSVRDVVGAGSVLPAELRADAECRFGHDFGDVRLHDNGPAHELARQLDARAFTVGADIVFGDGRYAPGAEAGRLLLGHELAHVVQQRGGAGGSAPGPAHERAADASARALIDGRGPVGAGPPAARWVQRQPVSSSIDPEPDDEAVDPQTIAGVTEIAADLSGLVNGLLVDVLANPEHYALNTVRHVAGELKRVEPFVSALASRNGAPASIVAAAAMLRTLRSTFEPVGWGGAGVVEQRGMGQGRLALRDR
jgi:Domain of unknown function (DUF4157)